MCQSGPTSRSARLSGDARCSPSRRSRLKFAQGLCGLLAFIQPLENAVTSQSSQDLHNRGWGFALFIIGLAIAANVLSFTIHKRTYLQPPNNASAPKAAAH